MKITLPRITARIAAHALTVASPRRRDRRRRRPRAVSMPGRAWRLAAGLAAGSGAVGQGVTGMS
jgi:hypothetical protein